MKCLILDHFGATFALSTLTAAAFGQVISDSSGTLFGGVIDAASAKLGVRQPRVTPFFNTSKG